MTTHPPLSLVAGHIPYGFECRSCGGSAYNWVLKCARYVETGEGCCPDFRQWIEKAKAGGPSVEEQHKARLAKDAPPQSPDPLSQTVAPSTELAPPLQRGSANG